MHADITDLVGQEVVELDLPLALSGHPACSLEQVLKFAILVQAVPPGGLQDVLLDLWPSGKELAPLGVVLECELVSSTGIISVARIKCSVSVRYTNLGMSHRTPGYLQHDRQYPFWDFSCRPWNTHLFSNHVPPRSEFFS